MKRIIILFFALSISLMVLFNAGLNVRAYLDQFKNLPTFKDVYDFVVKFFNGNISYLMTNVGQVSLGNILSWVGVVISGVFVVFVIAPTYALYIVIRYAIAIIPWGNAWIQLS